MAAFTTSTLAAGNHTITASYDGDANFTGSAASPVSQVVNRDITITDVTSSHNPSRFGEAVTFTATVRAISPAAGGRIPTGAVRFLANDTVIGTSTLNANGVATFTTTTLAIGSHTITASYDGDAALNGSTSPLPVAQMVTGCPDPAAAHAAGFNNGYNRGFNQGFNPGFNRGFNPGFRAGFQAGSRSRRHAPLAHAALPSRGQAAPREASPLACDQISAQGFNAGFNPGFNAGFNRGFNPGYNRGFQVGFNAAFNARRHG